MCGVPWHTAYALNAATTELERRDAEVAAQGMVVTALAAAGTRAYCPPSRRHAYEPSFLESSGTLDVAHQGQVEIARHVIDTRCEPSFVELNDIL